VPATYPSRPAKNRHASRFADVRLTPIVLACTLGAAACPAGAAESGYPTRSIRWIVAFAPGGSLDRVARMLAPRLSEALGQQIVIDNRPGAGGNLSAELVARSAPDGYTVYVTSAALVVNASLYKKLPYDPIKDFEPVTLLGAASNVLVAHPSLPVKSVADLIALAKRSPGRIDYVSSGNGTSGHLAMALFANLADIRLTHIPYKSIAQAQADLVAGQVPLFFPTIPGAMPFINAGRVRALAVSGTKRSPALPQVPTMQEAGVRGYEASAWYPVLVPAGTPRPIVEHLNARFISVVKNADVRKQLSDDGVEPIGSTPAELATYMAAELKKWAQVVKQAGIEAQ
jgi:tripartite-type tricarboxylate transporter receptor subunit TctC